MRIIFIFLILLLGLISCKQHQNDRIKYKIPSFAEEVKIIPIDLGIDSLMVMDVSRGMVICCQYLITSSSTNNYAVQVFDKINGKFIQSIAAFGRKQEEVSSPFILPVVWKDTLYLLNMQTDLKAIPYLCRNGIRILPDKIMNLNNFRGIKQISPLDGNNFFIYNSGVIRLINKRNEILKEYRMYPKFKETKDTAEIKAFFEPQASRARFYMKPDRTKFVDRTSSDFVSMIELYDIIGTDLIKYNELRFSKPAFKIEREYNISGIRAKVLFPSERSIVGIVDMAVDNNNIYILFNKSLSQSQNSYYNAHQIWCFDWEGNPVKKYIVEGMGITGMALDTECNRMYLTQQDVNTEEHFTYFNL